MTTKSRTVVRPAPAPEAAPKTRTRSSETMVRRRPGSSRMASTYEAGIDHPLLPKVTDAAPSASAAQQRFMQGLSRHMYRNEAWGRNLVRVMGDLYIGRGPRPVSRFPERDALILAASKDFDNRGLRNMGGWLREDVFRNFCVDGEAFIRFRDRTDYPEADDLLLNFQLQSLTSEFVPHDYNQTLGNLKFRNGVSTFLDRPTWYACYREHPAEPGTSREIVPIPAKEMLHYFDPLTGASRGEVPLASGLLRAIKASTLEDSELRRKLVAANSSVFIERPHDAESANDLGLSPGEISDMIDAIELKPGGVFELPYGYKLTSFEPKDEPANYEKALRWNLMAICAAAGIPSHYVTGDWSTITERMVRFVDQGIERRADIVHDGLERMVLDPVHKRAVDYTMSQGLWTPPADLKPWELYACTWEWDKLPNAAFSRELQSLLMAEEQGAIDMDHVSETMFGKSLQSVQRDAAMGAARAKALGLQRKQEIWQPGTSVSDRIAAQVLAEEEFERDLIDASAVEDAIIDADLA